MTETRAYGEADIADALSAAGLGRGDLVFLSTQLYGLGPMRGVKSQEEMSAAHYRALRSVIGDEGTLVVPTYTPQVGRYGLPFVLEETPGLTGIIGEYVRHRPDAIRSLHPVFSVAAIGPLAARICDDVSPVAFGYDSVYDRLNAIGGKMVCVGLPYYAAQIVACVHYVETRFAVPYYYNKLVTSEVFAGGRRVDREFVINVKYFNLDTEFSFNRYVDRVAELGLIRQAPLGRGTIYCNDLRATVEAGLDLLKRDPYAFLDHPPRYVPGTIPHDGPPEPGQAPEKPNWVGYYIGV